MSIFPDEIIEKAKQAKSVEELIALAGKNGIELTAEEANTYFDQLNSQSGELSDDELDNVSGGGCGGGDSNKHKVNPKGYCQLWEPGEFLAQELGRTLTMQKPNGEWGTYTITLEFLYSPGLLEVCPNWRTCAYCRFYHRPDQTCTNYSVNF